MIPPPRWDIDDFDRQIAGAKAAFRLERLDEPADRYLREFDKWSRVFTEIFDASVDLTRLNEQAFRRLLPGPEYLEAFRYLAGPPISSDDLRTIAEVKSVAPATLRSDPQTAERVIAVVGWGLDRRRFEWVEAHRRAAPSERTAAILASATLLSAQRVQTARRTHAKRQQEQKVKLQLTHWGFSEVARRRIESVRDAPEPGEFCAESEVVGQKADVIVGVWDRRVLLIECKTSNSEVNSYKRVNHEAAGKAHVWLNRLGDANCVAAAVLSGVFKRDNLLEAQRRGLTLFWAHDLSPLRAWLDATK